MTNNVLITLRSSPSAAATLLWLPHAGGSAAFFQDFSNALPERIECLAVEYPGRGRRFREPVRSSFTSLVGEIAEAYAEISQDRTVVLFGHSMGAAVAFEVCRRLLAMNAGVPPKRLIVSACEPLHVESTMPLLHKLPDDELVDILMTMDSEASLGELTKELLLINLKTIRADLTLGETHRFTPFSPPHQRLVVYNGTGDSLVRPDILSRWGELSSGTTTFRNFDGGHFYMLRRSAEFIAALSEDIFGAVQDH